MCGVCVERNLEQNSAYQDLVGEPQVNRYLKRHRHTWNDCIKIDLK